MTSRDWTLLGIAILFVLSSSLFLSQYGMTWQPLLLILAFVVGWMLRRIQSENSDEDE